MVSVFEIGGMFQYFLGVRYYFLFESLAILGLLVYVMLKFGRAVQGSDKPVLWSSPQPASRYYSGAAIVLWLAGMSLAFQASKIWVIIGICMVIAGIQLAFHVNLMLMGIWYIAETGKPMLGLGNLAARNKHRVYLDKAKNRGKQCLLKAKNPGFLWVDKPIKLQ